MTITKEIETVEKVTMTVKECSEFIGTSTTTIYTMVREGQLPNVRVRGKILFYRPSIIEWLKGELEEV